MTHGGGPCVAGSLGFVPFASRTPEPRLLNWPEVVGEHLRVAEKGGSVLHQQALTALGYFVGFTLTSLVLILNAPGPFMGRSAPSQANSTFRRS
jgi:hypothetical protein